MSIFIPNEVAFSGEVTAPDTGPPPPGQGPEASNRRSHQRVEMDGSIAVRVPDWPTLVARTYDLSKGGIRVALPAYVRDGDMVEFGLELPGARSVRLRATVRHVVPEPARNEVVAGLEWHGLDPHEQALVDAMVEQIARLEGVRRGGAPAGMPEPGGIRLTPWDHPRLAN